MHCALVLPVAAVVQVPAQGGADAGPVPLVADGPARTKFAGCCREPSNWRRGFPELLGVVASSSSVKTKSQSLMKGTVHFTRSEPAIAAHSKALAFCSSRKSVVTESRALYCERDSKHRLELPVPETPLAGSR